MMFSISKTRAGCAARRVLRRPPSSLLASAATTTTRSLSSAAEQIEDDEASSSLYPTLLSPITLPNGVVLQNRILMGSMHTGLEGHSIPPWMDRWVLGERNSHATDLSRMAQYMAERASAGIMVTGGIAPNVEGWVGPFAAKLTTLQERDGHAQVTEAVHEANPDAKICMQILHAGRYAYHPLAVSASATQSPISPFKARALTESGVAQTIQDYVTCASLAQEAGYDGVEVMGSEGYLISQFLSPRTNHRKDEFGGDSLEHRAKFPLDIVRGIRQATSSDFIIIFRISLLDLVEGGMKWSECVQLAQWLEEAGATILNSGIGWHEARVPTIATSVPRGAFVQPTRLLKEANVTSLPLVSTNRINNPETAESILSSGASDLVSMARPFLADPEFVIKAKEGRADEINTCIACNQACLDHAFVGKTASCLVNPRACHETLISLDPLPENERLSIGVIGAGPAGCAFAIAAAQKGHTVTLYDAQSSIGGQFHMAKRVPGKEEFHETLRYFQVQLDKHGVQLQLNTRLSVEDMAKDTSTEKWIVATGVDPRDARIPGSEKNPNVLSYIDVLKHNAKVGEKVAIIGAGGIGFDVAEFLLHSDDGKDKRANDVSVEDWWNEWGVDPTNQDRGGLLKDTTTPKPHRQIYLLQRKKGKVGAGLGKTTGWIHRATLTKSNAVTMMNGVKYEKVDENGNLHILNKDGKPQVLDVDTVVVCAGQLEQADLAKEATPELKDKVYTIGGAYLAGELDAKRAIDMGTRLAAEIHKPEVVPGEHIFQSPAGSEEKMMTLLRKYM